MRIELLQFFIMLEDLLGVLAVPAVLGSDLLDGLLGLGLEEDDYRAVLCVVESVDVVRRHVEQAVASLSDCVTDRPESNDARFQLLVFVQALPSF